MQFQVANFTGWEKDLLKMRTQTVTLAYLSSSLINYYHEFEDGNITVEAQREEELVPYIPEFNPFLNEQFLHVFFNSWEAEEHFVEICEAVFKADYNRSITYDYIAIVCFIVLISLAFPSTLVFFAVWCSLLIKQRKIMKLFFALPFDQIGSVYQELKKKTREQSKVQASNYEIRIILFFLVTALIFAVALIISFVATLVSLKESVSNLSRF